MYLTVLYYFVRQRGPNIVLYLS